MCNHLVAVGPLGCYLILSVILHGNTQCMCVQSLRISEICIAHLATSSIILNAPLWTSFRHPQMLSQRMLFHLTTLTTNSNPHAVSHTSHLISDGSHLITSIPHLLIVKIIPSTQRHCEVWRRQHWRRGWLLAIAMAGWSCFNSSVRILCAYVTTIRPLNMIDTHRSWRHPMAWSLSQDLQCPLPMSAFSPGHLCWGEWQ